MTTYSILEIKCIVFMIVWIRVWAEYFLQCGVAFCWLSIVWLQGLFALIIIQRPAVKPLNQSCQPSWPWYLQLANGQAYGWLPRLAWSHQAICPVVVSAGLTASSPARLFTPGIAVMILAVLAAASLASLVKPGHSLCYGIGRASCGFPGFLLLGQPGWPRLLGQALTPVWPGSWCKGGRAYHQHIIMIKISNKQVKQFFVLRLKWS